MHAARRGAFGGGGAQSFTSLALSMWAVSSSKMEMALTKSS
jgi:hypothetical protein